MEGEYHEKSFIKITSMVLIFVVILSIIVYVKTSDENEFYPTLNISTELMEEGGKNIFGFDDIVMMTSTALKKTTATNVSTEPLDYKLKIKEDEDGFAVVDFRGQFSINGKQASFNIKNAKIRMAVTDDETIVYKGAIGDVINVDGLQHDMSMAFEQYGDNLYIAITVNRLGDTDGIALVQFGQSILSKVQSDELFKSKDTIVTNADYNYVSGDFEEIVGNETGWDVIWSRMYLEDRLTAGLQTGRVLTRWQYDSDKLLAEFDTKFSGYRFENIECMNLYVDYESIDDEAVFGSQDPSEDDTANEIGTWVAAALYDVGSPSSWGLGILGLMISSTNPGVIILYDNNSYRRIFSINTSGEEYMDRSDDLDAGYCVEVFIAQTDDPNDDDIGVIGERELGYYMYDEYNNYIGWATVDTRQCSMSVDLVNYK